MTRQAGGGWKGQKSTTVCVLHFITGRTLNDTIATWPGHSQWTYHAAEVKDLYWPGLVSSDTCKDEVIVM